MRILKAALATGIFLTGFTGTSQAFADEGLLEAVPTAWRLQDYGDGAVVMYYTGAAQCNQGELILPASAPADSKNRLWTLILSAKVTGKVVGVYYNPTTCTVNSFYLKES